MPTGANRKPQVTPAIALSPPAAAVPTKHRSLDEDPNMDVVKRQVYPYWNFDSSSRDPASLVVRIHVVLDSDGSVKRAEIVDNERYLTDSDFRRLADNALSLWWSKKGQ